MSKETELADLLIERLNMLIANDDVRKDIEALIATRIPCSQTTLDHPTILAGWPTSAQDAGMPPTFGFLGLLNGIVGALPDGPRVGWGYITAFYDAEGEEHRLKRFGRTDEQPVQRDGPQHRQEDPPTVLRDRLERAAEVLFEVHSIDLDHEIACHAESLPERYRRVVGMATKAWEIVAEGTQDIG